MTAYARASDPLTSHEAAASISEQSQRSSQQAVLSALRIQGPLTTDQLSDYIGDAWVKSRIGTACVELERRGYIERASEQGKSSRGRACTIWKRADR